MRALPLALAAMMAFLPNAAADSHDELPDLRGIASEPASLLISGVVQPAPEQEWFAHWTPLPDMTQVLTGARAQLDVLERRSPAIMVSGTTGFASVDDDGPVVPSSRQLFELEVQSASNLPTADWLVRSATNGTIQGDAGSCRLDNLGPLADESYHGFHDYTLPYTRTMDATCDTRAVRVGGAIDWYVWNSTLVLRYAKNPGGARQQETIRTGSFTEPNQTIPAQNDNVLRVVRIRTDANDVRWDGVGPLTIRTYAVAATGSLELGTFSGEIDWENNHYDTGPLTPTPRGYFVVRADQQGFGVAGFTTNGPVLPSAPIERIDAGAAAITTASVAAFIGIAFWLYARLTRDRLYDHEARRRLLAYIGAHAGATNAELLSSLGMKRSSLLHHLALLRREDLIVRVKTDHEWLYAVKAQEPQLRDPTFLASIRRPQEVVLGIISKEPNLRQREIAQRSGYTQSYVSRILKRMEARGTIARVRNGGRLVYEIRSNATSILTL